MYTTLRGCEVQYDDQGQGTPLLLMHAFPLNQTVVDRVRQMIEASSPEAIVRMLAALATRPGSTPALASIAVLALVIAGERMSPPRPRSPLSGRRHPRRRRP